MCNVGSVGQPRDGDIRGPATSFKKTTTHVPPRRLRSGARRPNKIYNMPDLDNFLGDRIKQGR